MDMVKTTGFVVETNSSHNRLAVHYYAKNINNIYRVSYILFLASIKSDLIYILKTSIEKKMQLQLI